MNSIFFRLKKITSILPLFLFLFLNLNLFSKTVDKNSSNELKNNVVIEWNNFIYTIANEHDQFYSFIGVRALAMSHIAMHDALNAIVPKYEQYSFKGKEKQADPIAAVSQAAHDVALAAYPKRKKEIDNFNKSWLDKIPDGKGKNLGIELGKKSAASIIDLRKGDGHEKQGDYTPMTKPGDYQYTPGFDWVWKPDFSVARPFSLKSVSQFRSPPPPKLISKEYAESYNEVKEYGCKDSNLRSKDQTNYAHWWAEFAEHSWNRIGRITASEHNLPLWETARMFALINMDIYDIYLASFDSKYFYDTWRPYTAIRSGDSDGNPETKADTSWTPEMVTPPWPEYPSAHASVAAGGAEVVAYIYSTHDVSFTMESTSALPDAKVRSYTNLNKAADDCADSRIMNGYHFRFATEEGKKQGRDVAKNLISNYLRQIQKSAK